MDTVTRDKLIREMRTPERRHAAEFSPMKEIFVFAIVNVFLLVVTILLLEKFF